MIEYRIVFICDECGRNVYYVTDGKIRAIEYARKDGWAVARDRLKCYCPDCADGARSVGMRGRFNSNRIYYFDGNGQRLRRPKKNFPV